MFFTKKQVSSASGSVAAPSRTKLCSSHWASSQTPSSQPKTPSSLRFQERLPKFLSRKGKSSASDASFKPCEDEAAATQNTSRSVLARLRKRVFRSKPSTAASASVCSNPSLLYFTEDDDWLLVSRAFNEECTNAMSAILKQEDSPVPLQSEHESNDNLESLSHTSDLTLTERCSASHLPQHKMNPLTSTSNEEPPLSIQESAFVSLPNPSADTAQGHSYQKLLPPTPSGQDKALPRTPQPDKLLPPTQYDQALSSAPLVEEQQIHEAQLLLGLSSLSLWDVKQEETELEEAARLLLVLRSLCPSIKSLSQYQPGSSNTGPQQVDHIVDTAEQSLEEYSTILSGDEDLSLSLYGASVSVEDDDGSLSLHGASLSEIGNCSEDSESTIIPSLSIHHASEPVPIEDASYDAEISFGSSIVLSEDEQTQQDAHRLLDLNALRLSEQEEQQKLEAARARLLLLQHPISLS